MSRCDTLLDTLDAEQAETKPTELQAEAQARFAKDPATLAKVKQLLAQETERPRILPKKPAPRPK